MIPARKKVSYEDFVKNKLRKVQPVGFNPPLPLNEKLFDWQKVVVTHGLKLGRCAFFEDCGLGKAAQQMEWAKQVCAKTGGKVLILAPIGVTNQTQEVEAPKFGYEVTRCKSGEDVKDGINITNYERLHLFDGVEFSGVVLDESSILKSFDGKTRKRLTERFASTPYRLCCTATPAPNDFTELGQHADFLGVCSPAQMLATYFINDTFDTGTWRVKGHAEEAFWKWVSSWAVCISKPSDIGFGDDGFNLPELSIEPIWIDVNETSEERKEGELFRVANTSATTINKEMRMSMDDRVKMVKEIIGNSKEQWSVWCNLNDEQGALEKALGDGCVSVKGSSTEVQRINRERDWRTGKVQTMVSKGSIFGYGMNWQHCHNLIVFPTYSHEDFYQIVRRFYRFGQKEMVKCFLILPRTAHSVLNALNRKKDQHELMQKMMRYTREAIGVETIKEVKMNTEIKNKTGNGWTMYHGDCVRVAKTFKDNSIGFSVFSPPFADLFTHSEDVQDMGNCSNMDDFTVHFGYLIDELSRVMMPGREIAVHCCDLLATKWKDGAIEFKNFSDVIYRAFHQRGLLFHSRVCIWKSPVTEMQRTKAHGLLYKTLQKDSSNSRVGSADYLLVFRKRGENPVPIVHTPDDLPLDLWQEIASPVWMTVDQGNVLNGKNCKEQKDERHICPLQLDVINRALILWSMKDDLVFSPFAGIGSEGYCAVKMGRKFVGSELKQSYFDQACVNLNSGTEESKTLFNLK